MTRANAFSAIAAISISAFLAGAAVSAERRGMEGRAPIVGGKVVPPLQQDTVVYATTSVKCGNTVYEVSTGTSGGACEVNRFPGQPTQGANCTDGGNAAEANCTTGCGNATGAGSCTIKSAQ